MLKFPKLIYRLPISSVSVLLHGEVVWRKENYWELTGQPGWHSQQLTGDEVNQRSHLKKEESKDCSLKFSTYHTCAVAHTHLHL